MTKQYSKVFYIYNSRATNQKRARKLFEKYITDSKVKKYKEIEILHRGPDKSKQDIETTGKDFDSNTLLLLGGGDGSVNFVLETILSSDKLSVRNKQARILPVWGGNASDLSVMLNGHPNDNPDLWKMLNETECIKVYPLQVSIFAPNKAEFHRLAFCYASFGITAHAIDQIEKSSKNVNVRLFSSMPMRLIPETMDFIKAFIQAEPFVVKTKKNKQKISERIFINGSRIAKIERFPIKLNKRQYYATSSSKKKFYLNAMRMMLKPDPKKIKSGPTTFEIADKTLCQIDGETINISPGTKVRISISKTPFYTLSTKLKN